MLLPPSAKSNPMLPPDPHELARLVLSHRGASPSALSRRLLPFSAALSASPAHVDAVIKSLWNHAPLAILFLRSLLLLPSFLPSPSSLDLALSLSARLRHPPSRSLSLLPPSLPPSPRTLRILLERHASAGHPDRAVQLFLSSSRLGFPPPDTSSFNSLLHALCQSRHVEKAASLSRSLRRRFPPDAITFNILADGWCRCGRTPDAISTLKHMVQSGIHPTISTYNILLNGFFRSHQTDAAVQFFKQMKRRTTPDIVSYTTMIFGLGLTGRVGSARKVFGEMLRRGVAPTVATYNALIQVLCRKDSLENAMLVLDEMVVKGCTPNLITYNTIIRGLCHAGDTDGAVEFMGRMRSQGWKPNVHSYNILIRCRTEAGEIEKGMELFKEMWEIAGCLPDKDTFNVLISAMFVRKRRDDMLTAGKLVVEMVERGFLPRRFMFNRVLNGLLLTGNQEFARELLRVHSSCPRLRKEIRL